MAPAFVTGAVLPRSGLSFDTATVCAEPSRLLHTAPATYVPLEIYAAKHAQLKAAKKANRLRPKKHRPSDINRAPPPYDPVPHRDTLHEPSYTVLDEAAVAALDAAEKVDGAVVLTAADVKALEDAKKLEEETAQKEWEEKRAKARAQRKKDKELVKKSKMEEHLERKKKFAEAVAAIEAKFYAGDAVNTPEEGTADAGQDAEADEQVDAAAEVEALEEDKPATEA